MQRLILILSTGFALFSMFFGSGNLVFPLNVGKESGNAFLIGSLSFLMTGVLVPFLGAFTVLLYKGDLKDFFKGFGKSSHFWFSLIALSLMGPFGVLARCITVAHASFLFLFPNLSLPVFSLGMLTLIFATTLKKNQIVPFVGKLLTPILLASLGVIVFFTLSNASPLSEVGAPLVENPFTFGLHQGYQTMDLLAAFFFSVFIIRHLESYQSEKKNIFKNVFLSGLVGAALLSLVYLFLIYLGAEHRAVLENTPQEGMIGAIALAVLGAQAGYVTCVFITMACLTTAIVLAVLYADFLKEQAFPKVLNGPSAMLITLAISFCISTLEFSGIAAFIGPILEMLYPALILLTLFNLVETLGIFKMPRWPVAATFAANIAWTLFI